MNYRRFVLFATAVIFVPTLLVVLTTDVPQASAAVACSASAIAQNGIKVVPSHGSVFYIDTSVSPRLDAGYIGYRVTNNTTSTQSTLWTQVSSFTGGVLALNNSADSVMQLPSLAVNATGTSYFMLKASTASLVVQTHTVKIYDDRPDLSSATLLYECVYSFTKIQETIKAASNKVVNNGLTSAAAIEVSDTTPELGQSIVISVEGETGQIGAGSSPDFDIVWLTPAAIASWPTRSLRLESVSVTFDGNSNWANTADQVSYTDQLLITSANGTNVDTSSYRAYYTFRVIGVPQSSVTIVPVAQIASGTQVKHTDTGAAGATVNISFASLAINVTLTKTISATSSLTVVTCTTSCVVPSGVNGQTYASVPFRIQAVGSTATGVNIDEIIDVPASGVIFKPSSATITDTTRTNVAVADPVYILSEAAVVPRPYHFIGPFTLNSATSVILNYDMWVPVGSASNTAYSVIGDVLVGATSSSKSVVTVTSDGSTSVTAVTSTVSFPITAVTDPATNVTTTSATLNGTVDPNGANPLIGSFEYSTSSSLTSSISITATTPTSGVLSSLADPTTVSVNLTGLNTGTTYYYRVVAGSVTGTILSFTTLSTLSAPSVTTLAATNVGLASSTLNGTINPNLTPITGIQFIYGTSSTLTSGTATSTQDDGTGLAALTAGGSSLQPFVQDVTGLTSGLTYYFKIRACTSTLTGTYPTVACTGFVDGSILSFMAASAPSVTTTAATSVSSSSATLNGTVNANFSTTTASFEYSTVSNLSSGTSTISAGSVTGSASTVISAPLTGLAASTTYYFRAVGVNSMGTTSGTILSFTTAAVNRTLTINAGSYVSSYVFTATPPTLTATSSAGGGAITFTSQTTGVCTVNSTTGLVAFVSAGTCTIYATIAADGAYTDAASPSISFTITAASRTLTIDAASYTSSYSLSATPPTLTATPSAGTGTIAFTQSTPSVCTINSSSGLVAFATTGTCMLGSTITASGGYASATASNISFTITVALTAPTVTTAAATSVATSTATLNGNITATGGATSTSRGFQYGLTTSYGATTTLAGSFGITAFSDGVTGLTPSSTYHVRAYAINSQGIAYGNDVTFTTTQISRTLTIDASSYTSSYSLIATPPTLTATPSAGTGTIAFTQATPSVCTINSTSGLVAFVTTGTCTLGSTITASGGYASATASNISFTISSSTRTISIDAASYASTYQITATPPTLTSTVTAGSGTKTYSSVSTGICTINASTGLVAFVSAGTCRISVTITSDGTYATATSAEITFTVTVTSTVNPSGGGSGPMTPPVTNSPSVIVATPPSPSAPAGSQQVIGCMTVAPYIINPDSTQRRSGTRFVRQQQLSEHVTEYAFEDKGDDFDYNDFVMRIDRSKCDAPVITGAVEDARWHHEVRLEVSFEGRRADDVLLWKDSHLANGQRTVLNAAAIASSVSGSLSASAASSVSACSATGIRLGVRFGSRGEAVRALQDFLKCTGFLSRDIPTSVYFGTLTQKALQNFQLSQAIPPVGFIGPRTLLSIRAY